MSLSKRDQKHLWHPLTQHKTSGEMLAMVKGKGAYLWDEKGNKYIDAISSWYTTVYGHCNEDITRSVAEQMQSLDQVVFSGFTHAPAVELSEALIGILPYNQEKLFFSDNGSTSVEIAIKMALQYHFNQGKKRTVLVAFEEGFHGDTFGAMSVSDLSIYNGPFEEFFLEVKRISVPTGENNQAVLQQLENLIKSEAIAGFIYEPLVQGAAAMKMHDADGLCQLIRLCQEHDVITIADEVMTGFGKTGTHFASDHMLNKPDIMCLSKALTAGLLPMAITSCAQKIYDAFYDDELRKGFFHGHTYTANPLACRAALAGIKLLTSDPIKTGIKHIIASHQEFDQEIRQHPMVKQTRHCGVIYAIDLNINMSRYGDLRNQLFQFFMDRGIFLRPLGNTIYILPPYIISNDQLTIIYQAIKECLNHPILNQRDQPHSLL
ncbi:adenosylmethionine--8-amino-7-oxononanoate transaminase [Gangjinia marincola]|uniref:Adenosylmethionine-8-amino-7-oxononanoate aminotransferase n=1 Tax=Gangjinia marincola TaxID=578463 RepID=A0ABP3XW95_9FLAO